MFLDEPWEDAPTEPSNHRRAGGRGTVLFQVWIPPTVRGQLQELAHEETARRGRYVSASDIARRAFRRIIRDELKGV